MKYEITKGSEKDFEGAPESALVKIHYKEDEDDFVFAEKFELAAKFWYVDGSLGSLNGYYNHGTVIAERRPITEPELKPIYGDGIHDDSEALQQRIDMGIDINNIICEQGKLFNISRPLQFKPITKPVWSGEGLPPVGCVCEYRGNDTSWGEVKIIGHDEGKVVFKPSGEDYYGITPSHKAEFLPIRSPEDVARDEFGAAVAGYLDVRPNGVRMSELYDAIAAGKIPGVKLEGK